MGSCAATRGPSSTLPSSTRWSRSPNGLRLSGVSRRRPCRNDEVRPLGRDGEGWFVINAQEVRWRERDHVGRWCDFEGKRPLPAARRQHQRPAAGREPRPLPPREGAGGLPRPRRLLAVLIVEDEERELHAVGLRPLPAGDRPHDRRCRRRAVRGLRRRGARHRPKGDRLSRCRRRRSASASQSGRRRPSPPRPTPISRPRTASPTAAGSRSSRSKTSSSAAAACGRTSSTETGRPSSPCDRREGGVLEPAGRDPLGERRGVEVDVQRVAVGRHPLRDVDADAGDLARRPFQPDSCQPLDPRRLDAEPPRSCGSTLPRDRGSSASRPARDESGRGSGSRRAGRGRGRWTSRPGRSRRSRPGRLRGRAARRAPTGGRA